MTTTLPVCHSALDWPSLFNVTGVGSVLYEPRVLSSAMVPFSKGTMIPGWETPFLLPQLATRDVHLPTSPCRARGLDGYI